MKNNFLKTINDAINLKRALINYDKEVLETIELFFNTLKKGNKILVCGNGGSAADAQHLSAEFLVRLRPKINRKPLPLISLALDTSTITACGNDYSFHKLFERNLEALGQKGDLLFCISTSGNSKNIIYALKKAKKLGIKSFSFLGNTGGIAKKLSDKYILIPNKNTARIQECHIFLGHYILEQVENKLIKN